MSVVQSARVFDNTEVAEERKRVKYIAPKLKPQVTLAREKKTLQSTQSVLIQKSTQIEQRQEVNRNSESYPAVRIVEDDEMAVD